MPVSGNSLGSGGANFDPCFQGLATGVGGPDDNVHSEIQGSTPGLFGYTEVPSTDGWRIRYSGSINWDDGPGIVLDGDLQSAACHLYGHALGLDHSIFNDATMSNVTGTQARSLAVDDIAGIQAIYGVRSADKPHIESLFVGGGQLTVFGSGFTANDNQVWFTAGGGLGDGTPVMVVNVPSSGGGTTLTVTIPAAAGPGDVLVRRSGTAHDDLSNAFPTDLQTSTCAPPAHICSTTPDSAGSGAVIDALGVPSPGGGGFSLACYGIPAHQNGIFFYGAAQASAPFGDGVLCVSGGGVGIFRFAPRQADAVGDVVMPLDFGAAPVAAGAGQWAPGTQWFAQFWYRDPAAGGAGFNLSDGLRLIVCP